MNVAILYVKLAPFHFARLESAGKLWTERGARLTCIEIAREQSNYSWGRSEYASDDFNYRTLFDGEYFSLKYRMIRQAINRALDEVQPDVLVINGWGHKESVAALGWCCRNRVPRVLISDSQSIDSPRRKWKETIKRSFVAQCHAGFVGGAPHIRYLASLGLSPEFCVTGCDVVDNEMFLSAAKTRRETSASPEQSSLRILSCLRLLKIKNVPAALRSLAELSAPWHWTIAGDGPERESITDYARALGLGDRVHLPGHIRYSDLPGLYAAADVYLQPSLSEPWGLAVNEAMAAGLPVVVSRQCGCHEDLVREGVNGYTFDPRSGESLICAMEKFWERRGEWAQMGEASADIIKSWSLELFARNLWRACELAHTRALELKGRVQPVARLCQVL
ncbi:MAG TPA: glycosyltransferase family 4 protein [Pyrinomonadaceae bacterium]